MVDPVIYKMDLKDVDWQEMKSTLVSDVFDNGRTVSQLQESFENSYLTGLELLVGRSPINLANHLINSTATLVIK